eukprot:CAMPEP_0115002534 /NCGR_PEP_ID=MMETSP0216-20121206/18059_1 /TAXON_ID=223996 /ORGANISM="Protocruzia adherens, Strain Boccale" /LENGTH=369 /DNA_ID=CAMNT_0002368139 /DNA_START=251 /DNA_END=1360 /DNA_ORIENTATION=+
MSARVSSQQDIETNDPNSVRIELREAYLPSHNGEAESVTEMTPSSPSLSSQGIDINPVLAALGIVGNDRTEESKSSSYEEDREESSTFRTPLDISLSDSSDSSSSTNSAAGRKKLKLAKDNNKAMIMYNIIVLTCHLVFGLYSTSSDCFLSVRNWFVLYAISRVAKLINLIITMIFLNSQTAEAYATRSFPIPLVVVYVFLDLFHAIAITYGSVEIFSSECSGDESVYIVSLIFVCFAYCYFVVMLLMVLPYLCHFYWAWKRRQVQNHELSPEVFDRLRKTKYAKIATDTNKTCCICLSDFTNSTKVVVISCNQPHIFHATCLKKWGMVSAKCPMCRGDIESSLPLKRSCCCSCCCCCKKKRVQSSSTN